MTKIIQINATANWGSTGRIAEGCNRLAKAQGWDTFFVFGRYFKPYNSIRITGPSNIIDILNHFVENILWDNEGLASRISTRQLIKKIKKINPDIIHLHNIHDHWLNYRILFKYLNSTKIKVVWTFHDFWAITGHCYHFVQQDCDKYITGCNKCPYTKHKFLPLIKQEIRNYNLKKELFSNNQRLTIVPVSVWVGDVVRKSFLKHKDIRVIPNGVDSSIFHPTTTDSTDSKECKDFILNLDNKFVIMAVSSQWKGDAKGMSDFLAMSNCLQSDEVIVLVGVSENISHSFPKNVIGIRRTDNQRSLAALYTRADVVCSFSSAETFGLTIIEAYACGTPVVVYDNTALPSLVTPETGFVIPNKDFNAAYNAIQNIRKKGKAHYSDMCIKIAREKYSENKCYEQYFKLYNELLDT